MSRPKKSTKTSRTRKITVKLPSGKKRVMNITMSNTAFKSLSSTQVKWLEKHGNDERDIDLINRALKTTSFKFYGNFRKEYAIEYLKAIDRGDGERFLFKDAELHTLFNAYVYSSAYNKASLEHRRLAYPDVRTFAKLSTHIEEDDILYDGFIDDDGFHVTTINIKDDQDTLEENEQILSFAYKNTSQFETQGEWLVISFE